MLNRHLYNILELLSQPFSKLLSTYTLHRNNPTIKYYSLHVLRSVLFIMRLLHTSDLVVRDVMEPSPPPFAILSHTWDEAELSFQDLNSAHFQSKVGFAKIQESCKIAAVQYRWIWIDTCCIDKSSSAELSEAINSMYRWYAESEICYVYLADFEEDRASLEGLQKCRWFKRGWTLQELLAPSKVIFF